MRTRHIAAISLVSLLGCADADDVGTADPAYATEKATIAFRSDWSIEVSGTLVEGARVEVDYDSSRLSDCRGDQNGHPAWTITGYYALNGSEAQSFFVDGFSATSAPADPAFTLTEPGELELWFHNTSRWGCSAYDSNFGDNFAFEVGTVESEPPAGPQAVLTFGPSGEAELSGELQRGGELRIDYDPERLTDCRGDQNGGPAWTITGYYSLDGAEPESFHVAGLSATSTVTSPVVPLGRSGELELWFHNTSRWGCSAYDADDGGNYRYTVR
jgi:hypothetical protein